VGRPIQRISAITGQGMAALFTALVPFLGTGAREEQGTEDVADALQD
jgi:hypothetical protein